MKYYYKLIISKQFTAAVAGFNRLEDLDKICVMYCGSVEKPG